MYISEVADNQNGDRLIQLLKEEPSHPTAPAAYLFLEQIIRDLKKRSGVNSIVPMTL